MTNCGRVLQARRSSNIHYMCFEFVCVVCFFYIPKKEDYFFNLERSAMCVCLTRAQIAQMLLLSDLTSPLLAGVTSINIMTERYTAPGESVMHSLSVALCNFGTALLLNIAIASWGKRCALCYFAGIILWLNSGTRLSKIN